jgi:hypothetical protein
VTPSGERGTSSTRCAAFKTKALGASASWYASLHLTTRRLDVARPVVHYVRVRGRTLNFVTHTAEFRDTQGRAGDKLNTLRSLQNEGARSLSKIGSSGTHPQVRLCTIVCGACDVGV